MKKILRGALFPLLHERLGLYFLIIVLDGLFVHAHPGLNDDGSGDGFHRLQLIHCTFEGGYVERSIVYGIHHLLVPILEDVDDVCVHSIQRNEISDLEREQLIDGCLSDLFDGLNGFRVNQVAFVEFVSEQGFLFFLVRDESLGVEDLFRVESGGHQSGQDGQIVGIGYGVFETGSVARLPVFFHDLGERGPFRTGRGGTDVDRFAEVLFVFFRQKVSGPSSGRSGGERTALARVFRFCVFGPLPDDLLFCPTTSSMFFGLEVEVIVGLSGGIKLARFALVHGHDRRGSSL